MYQILKYKNHEPKIDASAFIADGSRIIGKVEVGKNASIWFNCVIRGDVGSIKIGDGTKDPLRNKKITTQFVSLGTQITPIDDFASLRLSKQEDFLKT